MPLGHRPADEAADETRRRERAVLSAGAAVVTTSQWSRSRLLELYQLPPDRVHVAAPGADAADLATGTVAGGALLCVATVTFDKGHDVLVEALLRCRTCPGTASAWAAWTAIRRSSRVSAAASSGAAWRTVCRFPGPRTGADLDRSYASADLMVLASRAETYGMVVTEALARGLPVLATDVGGLPEAMGHGADDDPAWVAGPARRSRGTRRGPPSVARRRRAETPVAIGRAPAARVALRMVGHHVGRRWRP